jgi:hypothetical protein
MTTSQEIKDKIFQKFCIIDERNHTLLSPFLVSKKKKILFFHIAKTGGSSIDFMIKKNKLNDNILDNVSLDFKKRKEYFKTVVDEWDEYYKFTFIRNKYDLLVSLYHYDKRGALKNCSFEEFLKNHVLGRSENYPNYDYWIDQHFLTTVDDNPIFDFVGTFDNYKDDVKTVCKNINIPYEDIRKNVGSYNKNKSYNDYYSDDLKVIVQKKFARELEYFNW